MKTIPLEPLGQGHFAIVDDEDYKPLVILTAGGNHPWRVDMSELRRSGSLTCFQWINRKRYQMPRRILGIDTPRVKVHHYNGNNLDNRKQNLYVPRDVRKDLFKALFFCKGDRRRAGRMLGVSSSCIQCWFNQDKGARRYDGMAPW